MLLVAKIMLLSFNLKFVPCVLLLAFQTSSNTVVNAANLHADNKLTVCTHLRSAFPVPCQSVASSGCKLCFGLLDRTIIARGS